MNKLVGLLFVLSPLTAHAECDFTPDPKGFTFGFTAFGGADKSYIVTKNTFSNYELASDSGKLLNASINIDATTVDTSNDMNNGAGARWPDSFADIRDANVVNGLFNNFVNPGVVQANVSAISAAEIQLDVTMNDVTNTLPMTYRVAEGVLSAEGVLDILDFNGAKAFKMFEALCTVAWHQGKSWSDVEIQFSVPVAEGGC